MSKPILARVTARVCARLAALALVGLAGCAPYLAPAGPPVRQPALTDDAVIAADGARLPLRRWLPKGAPRAVVLALHGFNDYSKAFAAPAAAWAARGIATYAYDQRGFGRAPGHGLWAGRETLVADALEAAALLRARHRGVPLFLLGDSMGGAVAILAATRKGPPPSDGVILVAPALWGRAYMSALERGALWLAAHTVPWYPLTAQGLRITPSDNLAMLRRLARDPLVIKETRVDALAGLVDLMDAALAALPRLEGPALLLYGARDEIVPPEPVRAAVKRLRAAVRVAYYDRGYHMLLRDLGADRPIDDIAAWIADPKAPLPSGADRRAAARLAAE